MLMELNANIAVQIGILYPINLSLFVVYTVRVYENERPINRIISIHPAERYDNAQYEV